MVIDDPCGLKCTTDCFGLGLARRRRRLLRRLDFRELGFSALTWCVHGERKGGVGTLGHRFSSPAFAHALAHALSAERLLQVHHPPKVHVGTWTDPTTVRRVITSTYVP